ncbi:MAG: hypothetical protein WC435_03470 [Candidatus Paceibacterota bacterium]
MMTFAIIYFFFGFSAYFILRYISGERCFGFLSFFTAIGWGVLWPLPCVAFLVFPSGDFNEEMETELEEV